MNTQRLIGLIGVLRIFTLILGLIALIFTIIYHYKDIRDLFYLSVLIITVGTSFLLLVVLLMDVLSPNIANAMDMSYHLVAGLLLIIGGSLMLYSSILFGEQCEYWTKIGEPCPEGRQPLIPRLVAAGVGIINGILCLIMGIKIRWTEYI